MSVYKKLKGIRGLSNSSLTSIVDVSNLNFKDLSEANLEFLSNISYNEDTNSFTLYKGTFDFVNVTDKFSMILDKIPTFTIDSLGRAEGREILVSVAEAKRLRMTDFNDWPDVGVPGEIIYTGIQNQKPQFGEDFIGYLQGRGWVSLTDGATGYFTLFELTGSPPIPPSPGADQGILWIGAPGYETQYLPTSQTLYYSDENGAIYDVLTNHVWEKIGDDAFFKPEGKAVIGSPSNPKKFKYNDGNEAANYVLTSDVDGNASWQPVQTGGGGNSCSFIWIQGFTDSVTSTITHNLATTNVIVQIIDLTTNESVTAYIDNFQTNSIDITTSETLASIKIVILSADCTGGGGGDVTKYVTPFVLTAGIPLNINHGLNTYDFTYNTRIANDMIEVELVIVDLDNVTIESTVNIASGNITIMG